MSARFLWCASKLQGPSVPIYARWAHLRIKVDRPDWLDTVEIQPLISIGEKNSADWRGVGAHGAWTIVSDSIKLVYQFIFRIGDRNLGTLPKLLLRMSMQFPRINGWLRRHRSPASSKMKRNFTILPKMMDYGSICLFSLSNHSSPTMQLAVINQDSMFTCRTIRIALLQKSPKTKFAPVLSPNSLHKQTKQCQMTAYLIKLAYRISVLPPNTSLDLFRVWATFNTSAIQWFLMTLWSSRPTSSSLIGIIVAVYLFISGTSSVQYCGGVL